MPGNEPSIRKNPISKRYRPTEPAVTRRRGWMVACIISSVFFYFGGVFTVFIFWMPREAVFGVVGRVEGLIIPVETVPVWGSQLFHETFYHPADFHHSDYWVENYPPKKGGVFMHQPHPNVDPMDAEMAVFHQLHCIDDIECRLINGTDTGVCLPGTSIPKSRIDHCLDYLRRTVKCAVDTHLEHEKNMVIRVGNIDTTFNHSRVCRNFMDVKNIVSQLELLDRVRIDTLTHNETQYLHSLV